MMKPMLGLSLHVSMPACVHVLGVCADAGAAKISGTSKATANRTLVMRTPVEIICDCAKSLWVFVAWSFINEAVARTNYASRRDTAGTIVAGILDLGETSRARLY